MTSAVVGYWMQVSTTVPNAGLPVFAQPSKVEGQLRANHHQQAPPQASEPPVGFLQAGDYVKFESVGAPRGWGKLEASVLDVLQTHSGMHQHKRWKTRIAEGGQAVSGDTSHKKVFRGPRDKYPLRSAPELDDVLAGDQAGVAPRVYVVGARAPSVLLASTVLTRICCLPPCPDSDGLVCEAR
jgi:hypothetical protein